MAATELAAVAFGFVYILLAVRRQRACWIAGGISSALFAAVFLETGLPMQSALQIVFVVLAAYGWLSWRATAGESFRLRSWPVSRHALALAAVAVATAASVPLVERYALAAAPVADSLGTWASLFATWLLARRHAEAWLWWIAIDLGLAVLFASQGLPRTAVLYLAYAVLAGWGWWSWRRLHAVVA